MYLCVSGVGNKEWTPDFDICRTPMEIVAGQMAVVEDDHIGVDGAP
jgi:hypothetical protein